MCLPLGPSLCTALCSLFILSGCCSFSLGPQRHSCVSWAEGEWVFLALCGQPTHRPPASGNRSDEPFTHLLFVCLLLSKFLNNECFKNESQNGSFPRIKNKRGSAAVIGSTRGPQEVAPLQHHCLNCGLSQGWVGFSPFFAPSLWGRRGFQSVPLFPLGAGVTKHLYIVSGGRTPPPRPWYLSIALFSLHTLGPA